MIVKLMNGKMIDFGQIEENINEENKREIIFNKIKNDEILFSDQIKILEKDEENGYYNIFIEPLTVYKPEDIFNLINNKCKNDSYEFKKLLTKYLQYLADRKLLYLSVTEKKYCEVYYNKSEDSEEKLEKISSIVNQAFLTSDAIDYIIEEFIPERNNYNDDNDHYLCHYWIRVCGIIFAVSTIFHKDNLD